MKQILIIESSPRGSESASRSLTRKVYAGERLQPFYVEENDFTRVPEDELQVWKPVEDTCQDQTNELDSSLVMPTQTERRKGCIHRFSKTCVKSCPD